MEIKKSINTKNIMLKYGAYFGVGVVAINVIMYATGMVYSGNMMVGLVSSALTLLVSILAIVYGIKAFKGANGGFLAMGEALKIGVGIALIGGIIVTLYTYIFMNYIEPDFTKKIMELQFEKMGEMGMSMSETEMDAAIAMSDKMGAFTYISSLVGYLLLGLIVSAIAGAVMKKQEQVY
ncbi:DUF4199 domain-containing protein [Capnocytophaga canis]|uniref:DUF4199 domain-containing protein n=1 Tax=Capnocytophaga canis TaxID=1848903 RepID=A0A3A1YK51_9FLAO|nr:DUF4199 domain-containing protein [Capnocytophaga canis]RIY37578.1 DUF4199 domain-containing protein [Capnocytophaga canis]